MGNTEELMATEKLMEEEGKGRKHQCFRHFQSFGRDTGRRKKGSGFYHKDSSRQQAFFL